MIGVHKLTKESDTNILIEKLPGCLHISNNHPDIPMDAEDDFSHHRDNADDDKIPEILKHSKKPRDLPKFCTYKYFVPDECSESAARYAQNLYGDVIKEKMTNKVKNISQGYLDLEHQCVVSCARKGKFAKFMGQQSPAGFTFLPEEALFKVEYGVLEVFLEKSGKVPLCLQSLYEILLPMISLEFYQVYAHLTRAGFSVNRTNKRKLAVRKPQSDIVNFYVVVLNNCQTFPKFDEILEIFVDVGSTSVKIGRVVDDKVDFYTLAMVEFPDVPVG